MSRRSRIVLMSVALVLIAVPGVVVLRMAVRPAPPESRDLRAPVRVSAPVRDTSWTLLPYRGTLEGDRDATLSFRMGGEVVRLHVREGDEVSAGTLLAELDPSEMDATLERTRAELDRARAQEAHWEGELEVDERLFQVGAVSRTRLEATRLSHRSATLAREAAEAAMAEIRARADGTRLRASHAGTVSRIEVARGEAVAPGRPVLRLSGGEYRIRVDVLERDRARGIRPGGTASVVAPGCPAGEGRVTLVDASASPPFGSVRVFLAPEDPCLRGLSPGAPVEVIFRVEGVPDALFLPLAAIDFRGGTPRVFRIGPDETAEAVPVVLRGQRGDLQEVEGPLETGDRIVVVGTTNLRPGDPVRIPDDAPGELR
jgi:RND family efflux transporter MFP subunit